MNGYGMRGGCPMGYGRGGGYGRMYGGGGGGQTGVPFVPAPVAFFCMVVGLMIGMMIGRKQSMHMMGGGMGYGGYGDGEWMMRKKMMHRMGGGMYPHHHHHHHHGWGGDECECGEGEGQGQVEGGSHSEQRAEGAG